MDPTDPRRAAWQSYDVIVGSSAAALGLPLIGIHNAWDTATHLVVSGAHGEPPKSK